MRHSMYGRRTTDVAVCEWALSNTVGTPHGRKRNICVGGRVYNCFALVRGRRRTHCIIGIPLLKK
jgi:hypothetical protein